MKKYVAFLFVLLMLFFYLPGCQRNTFQQQGANENGKLQIVTSIFPVYDWVREILGDTAQHADLTMLLDNGVDLHSYQPTVDDLIKISTCDLFIYVGGESDGWVEGALKNAVNRDMVVINLMELLGDAVKEEEIVEGMQESSHAHEEEAHDHGEEEAHDHDHEEDSEQDHHHESESHHLDEHIWLSLRNAQFLCKEIANHLCEIDPPQQGVYLSNLSTYLEKLSGLDAKYQGVVEQGGRKTLLFGDRFPFRYLVEDYHLNYYAAFSGCSAETEASFETISFLANKVNELGLTCILKIEGSKHHIAETIVSNTTTQNQQVLTMNSMQSITANDVNRGITYLSVMEENLEVLEAALK